MTPGFGLVHQPHGLVGQYVRSVLDRPDHRVRCQLRAAAQAGPKAGALGLGGQAEEAAVLALGGFHPAHRAAVNAGGGDAGEKAAVKARIPGLEGEVAGIGGVCDGSGFHGGNDTQCVRLGTSRFRTCPQHGLPPTIHRLRVIAQDARRLRDFLPRKPTVQLASHRFSRPTTSAASSPPHITEEVALGLGRAFGTVASPGAGRDHGGRGPRWTAQRPGTVAGADARPEEAGIAVIDVGMVTTPMLYFAAHTLCRSGIQVTGSHNPRDYNGFKMVHGRPCHLRRRHPGPAHHDGKRELGAAKPVAVRARPWMCCRPTRSASLATSSWPAR